MGDLLDNKDEYAKVVSLFLAEQLRTRHVTLARAAEIAERVVANINLINTEHHFLQFVKALSSDFEELFDLTARVDMHLKASQKKQYEQKVRDFVIVVLAIDMNLASEVLQEAIKENSNVEILCGKFPQFKQFLERETK